MYALRFFLGVFESTSWPGIVNLIFNWYTPRELGKRLAIFGASGVAGNMFLGVLQAALYRNLDGAHGLEGWQWLFIVSGMITMAWGLLGFLVIPDSPAITRAAYLSGPERTLSHARMSRAGTATAEPVRPRLLARKIRLLLASPVAYLFLAAYLQFAWSQRANAYFLLYLRGVRGASGAPLYSVYAVNLVPLGGYALSIVSNVGLNALSDWRGWRWQVPCAAAALQLAATAALAAWPASHPAVVAFYFLTFATAAWGYALLAWLAHILRKEPEARSVIVGLAVTLVYVGHATIPLAAWRVSDSPRYPVGFPLAAAFCAGSIASILGMRYYVLRYPEILDHGFRRETGQSDTVVETADGSIRSDEEQGQKAVPKRGSPSSHKNR